MKECIHCHSHNIRKYGLKNDLQQYYCQDCKKHFTKKSDPNRNLIANNEKFCTSCKTFKPMSEFWHYKGKPRSQCKKCFSLKNASRFRKYDLNEELFLKLLEKQDNKCAICNAPFKSKRTTFVDHNHITNNIRGLLCPKCNILLGSCNDNLEILKLAISYLENNQ